MVAPLFVGLPVVLFLAVTRHGLATLQKPFRLLLSLRQAEYLILSLVITGAYVAVHVGTDWLFERTVEPLHLPELAVTASVTFAVVILFEPLKERLSEWTRRRLDANGEGTHAVVGRMLEVFASAEPAEIPRILAKWAKKASRAAAARVTVGPTSSMPGHEFWWPAASPCEIAREVPVRYGNTVIGFVAIAERTPRGPWSIARRGRPTSTYRRALLESLASASAMAMWVAGTHNDARARRPRPPLHPAVIGRGAMASAGRA
jgi:hypothetical protein